MAHSTNKGMNQTGEIMRFYVYCLASLKDIRPAGYPQTLVGCLISDIYIK
jgi:hypothetical protein